MKLLLSQITILERQRIELGDIPELADSLNRLGQINPILVEKVGKDTYNLLAGRRRLAAATHLKWDHIEATTRKDLTELQRQEIELEEDTKRKDRTWQERALAYLKLHRLKGYQDSDWTKKKLAELLGKSIGHVTEICNLAEVLDTTRDQITPWEQSLWACEGTYAAIAYLAQKNENAAYEEMCRRKAAKIMAEGAQPGPTPPLSNAQNLNPTRNATSPEEVKPIEPITIAIMNRKPEHGECSYALWFDNDDVEEGVKYLSPTGCALGWYTSHDNWLLSRDELIHLGYTPLPFPLIENMLKGPRHEPTPILNVQKYGLFIPMPGWKPLEPDRLRPSVIVAPYSGAIVEWSLDFMSRPQDKIWCPYGAEVVNRIAINYRQPVWTNPDEVKTSTTLKELKDYYTCKYQNVTFI